MSVILVLFLLVIFGLLFSEVFIYPGFLTNHSLFSPNWVLLIYTVGNLGLRFFTLTKVQSKIYQTNLFIIGPILSLVMIGLVLLEKMTYPNFIFSHLHLHPQMFYLLLLLSLLFSVTNYSSKFLQNTWSKLIMILPLYFYPTFLIRFYWPGLHAWFKGENSFLEQIQVIMLLVLFYLNLKIAKLPKLIKNYPICRWVFSFLATIFFLVAMEEISWGQKLFELPTPEFIAKQNVQREFNIHNNALIFPKVYYAYLFISGFAAFAWLLRHQIEKLVKKLKQCWLNLLVVPGYLFGYFLPSFIYVILRFNR